eukprot:TRINITY_DN1872_c0_g1_i2.p1 TRINITY_DN1872_c0_g1~~TRINITY_DN1872_c0_g1_i2.p1  ORF type:complete len:987 (-),score=280.96 TRINITY_DN1872_c0_g1_i2:1075-4035(-)
MSIFDDNGLLVTDSSPDVFLGTPSIYDGYTMDPVSFTPEGLAPLEIVPDLPQFLPSVSFMPDSAETLKVYFDTHGDVMLRVLSDYPDLSGKIISDNISMFIGMLLLEKESCMDISAALKQKGHDLSTARSVFRNPEFCTDLSRSCPRSVAALLSSKPEFRAAFSYSHFDEFREVCASRPDMFPARPPVVPIASQNVAYTGATVANDFGSPHSADTDPDFSPESTQILTDAFASEEFQRQLQGFAADKPWMPYFPDETGHETFANAFGTVPQQYHQDSHELAVVPIKQELMIDPHPTPGGGASRFVAGGRIFDYEERQATIGMDPKRACRSHQIGQPNATRPFTCHFKLFLENRRFDHNCQMVHVNDDDNPNKLVFNIRNDRDINVHMVVALLVSQDGREPWVPVDGLRLHRAHASKEDRRRRGPKRSPPWHIEAFSVADEATGMDLNCAQIELTFAIIVSSFTQNKKEPRKFKISISLLEFQHYPDLRVESEPFITSQRMPGHKDKHANVNLEAASAAAHMEDGGRKKTKIEPGTAIWRQSVGGVAEELRPYPKMISPLVHYAGLGAETIPGHVIYQNVKRIEGGMREMWDFTNRALSVQFATAPGRALVASPAAEVQQVDSDNGCIFLAIPPHHEPATFEVAISHDGSNGPLFNPDREVLFRYVDASAFREAFRQSSVGLTPPDATDYGGYGSSSSFGGSGAPGAFGGFDVSGPAPGGQYDAAHMQQRTSTSTEADKTPENDDDELPAADSPSELSQLTARYTQLSMADAATPAAQLTEPLESMAARFDIRRHTETGAFFGRLEEVPDEKLPPPDIFRNIIRANWHHRLEHETDIKLRQSLHERNPTTGFTPLHYCVLVGLPDIAEEMLWKGANVNVRDRSGSTPLHLCAETCDTETATLLMNYNADPYLRDAAKRTPMQRVPPQLRRRWMSDVVPELVDDSDEDDSDEQLDDVSDSSSDRVSARPVAVPFEVPAGKPGLEFSLD